jgi:alpha-1,2-glucosyltransferase
MRRQNLWSAVAITAILAASFGFIKNHELISDENGFYKTLEVLFQNRMAWNVVTDPKTYGEATMFPGWTLTLALSACWLGKLSAVTLRFHSFLAALAAILVFFGIERRFEGADAGVKTWQFAFLPTLYPFFFLIYTDLPSLFFILVAFYFVLKGNWPLTAFFGTASVLIRQTNVVWLAFFLVLLYAGKYGGRLNPKDFLEFVLESRAFWAVFFLFGVFMMVNRGVALGDREKHPVSLHVGNVYFILFSFFFIFLPLCLSRVKEVMRLLLRKEILALLALFFLVYWFGFTADHPYNRPELGCYLRNRVLRIAASNVWMRLLFFGIASYSLLCLMTVKLKENRCYLLYPATLLFLLPAWLIEPRYALIPLTLFLAMRERQKVRVECAGVIYSIIFSLLLFQRVQHKLFFL